MLNFFKFIYFPLFLAINIQAGASLEDVSDDEPKRNTGHMNWSKFSTVSVASVLGVSGGIKVATLLDVPEHGNLATIGCGVLGGGLAAYATSKIWNYITGSRVINVASASNACIVNRNPGGEDDGAVSFLMATQLYGYRHDGIYCIRRGLINAIETSYALHRKPWKKDQNFIDSMGDGLPANYWNKVLLKPFSMKTFVKGVGDIHPVLAFHKKDERIERDYSKVLIAFHGTREAVNWATNFNGGCGRLELGKEGLEGHKGFINAGKSVEKNRIIRALNELVGGTSLDDCQFIVTGHSLGGAVARVFALRMLDLLGEVGSRNSNNRVVVITLGQPYLWRDAIFGELKDVIGYQQPETDAEKAVLLMGHVNSNATNTLRLVTCAQYRGYIKDDPVSQKFSAVGNIVYPLFQLLWLPVTIPYAVYCAVAVNLGHGPSEPKYNVRVPDGCFTEAEFNEGKFPHEMKFYKLAIDSGN